MDPNILSAGEIAFLAAVYPSLGQRAGLLMGRPAALVARVARARGLRRAKAAAFYIDAMGRPWAFRSTWECALARWLDATRTRWDYEVRPFQVNVLGTVRTYTPDFWIYDDVGDLRQLIDVKGRQWEVQLLAINAFRAQYPNLHLEIWGPNCPFAQLVKVR